MYILCIFIISIATISLPLLSRFPKPLSPNLMFYFLSLFNYNFMSQINVDHAFMLLSIH